MANPTPPPQGDQDDAWTQSLGRAPKRASDPSRPPGPSGPPASLTLFAPVALMALACFGAIFVWSFCRIEPISGEFAILIHKTGEELAPDQILATSEDQKGIQLEVLPEGRYFRNPYSWAWEIAKTTDIPAGKLGVMTRHFGKDLPTGKILASEDTKGIMPEVLRPGKYRINPYAYQIEIFDATEVRPGYGGVVTSLIGDDIFSKDLPPENRNAFLVPEGFKGVQPAILEPGTYYLNPYMVNVAEVTLQSQRFEMSGDDAINFLTMDGFTVHVEGTVEYALIPQNLAHITHRVGDMDDIIKKIMMPLARGFSRIEGSKNPAKNYITGETRQHFQDRLENHLRTQCLTSGVAIRSVLIRNISPPDEIASIIREREVAVQDARKFEQQITQAKSKAELNRQEMLATQNRVKVESETTRLRAVIAAKQNHEVRLTEAHQQLEVAKLETAAAVAQADALLLGAEAERRVIELTNEANAGVIANQVNAFGGGLNFARHELNQKVGPRIQNILTSDSADGLGGLFRPFITPANRQ